MSAQNKTKAPLRKMSARVEKRGIVGVESAGPEDSRRIFTGLVAAPAKASNTPRKGRLPDFLPPAVPPDPPTCRCVLWALRCLWGSCANTRDVGWH